MRMKIITTVQQKEKERQTTKITTIMIEKEENLITHLFMIMAN